MNILRVRNDAVYNIRDYYLSVISHQVKITFVLCHQT